MTIPNPYQSPEEQEWKRGSPTDESTSGIAWYHHVWAAMPLLLMALGGLFGGAVGFAAYCINLSVFNSVRNPLMRYVGTGLISVTSIFGYVSLVAWIVRLSSTASP